MIINGREVEVDFKRAAQIQDRVNKVEQLPNSAKVEVNKRELTDLKLFANDAFDGSDAFGFSNNTLLTGKNSKENRKEYYTSYQEMSECNFIHRGLQIIADDCSLRNEDGHTFKILSDDDEIKEILEELFEERINLDKELWSIFYETCKLGDNFYEVIPDSYENPTMITRIRYLEPDRVNRIEKNGKLAFYTYMSDAKDQEELIFNRPSPDIKDEEKVMYKLEPWQIIHFKITDKDFYPYGGSLLKSGVKTYKRLQLLEDGMVIYRLARVPERRVFKIDVGTLPTNEANRYMNRIKDNYRTQQILDDKGNINRTASALSITQDMFIPVRDGAKGTDVSTLGPGTALNNIDDIRYFRDQILWTMNIPPEVLGFTSDQSGGAQGRGSLAMNDIKFSRFCERIQFCIDEGLTKIAAIELFFKKKKKSDLRNFKIQLTPPSNIKSLMDIEYLNQKMALIQAMNGTGLFPKKFILKKVMQMTDKEINDLSFFKDLENNAMQMSQDAGMGMTAAPMAGGDMSMQAPAPDASQPPAASVTTENLVKIFGKDILIEHKEDFSKLIKAMEEYNASLIKEEDDDVEDSLMIQEMIKSVTGIKEEKKTNNVSFGLLYENELGGLDFGKSFKVYETPKKKTGPKTGSDLIYEEKSIKLK